jgi:hypothetical protein
MPDVAYVGNHGATRLTKRPEYTYAGLASKSAEQTSLRTTAHFPWMGKIIQLQ